MYAIESVIESIRNLKCLNRVGYWVRRGCTLEWGEGSAAPSWGKANGQALRDLLVSRRSLASRLVHQGLLAREPVARGALGLARATLGAGQGAEPGALLCHIGKWHK